jgi:predicted PurR-regulated permease PerM
VDTVLGLLGLVAYIIGVITVAAAWVVVRITPAGRPKKPEETAETG